MAGTGKRADQKKTLVNKLYGKKYFGKQGVTSRGTARKKVKTMNLREIQNNLNSLMKKYGKNDVLELKGYKILGEGELKQKLIIKAKAFSASTKDKIKKVGGEAIEEKKKLVTSKEQIAKHKSEPKTNIKEEVKGEETESKKPKEEPKQ